MSHSSALSSPSWRNQVISAALISLALENFHYHLAALLWTHSNSLKSFSYWDIQNCIQYSRWGCTSAVQSGTMTVYQCCAWCTAGCSWAFCCQDALLPHIHLAVNLKPQIYFHMAGLQSLIPQFLCITRITLCQVENPAHAFVKFHMVGDCPALEYVQISL